MWVLALFQTDVQKYFLQYHTIISLSEKSDQPWFIHILRILEPVRLAFLMETLGDCLRLRARITWQISRSDLGEICSIRLSKTAGHEVKHSAIAGYFEGFANEYGPKIAWSWDAKMVSYSCASPKPTAQTLLEIIPMFRMLYISCYQFE